MKEEAPPKGSPRGLARGRSWAPADLMTLNFWAGRPAGGRLPAARVLLMFANPVS